jgi:hypothetical protein
VLTARPLVQALQHQDAPITLGFYRSLHKFLDVGIKSLYNLLSGFIYRDIWMRPDTVPRYAEELCVVAL